MRLKLLMIAAAGLLLQACSVVSSEKPLFTAADAAAAPGLRPGVWVMLEPGCKDFDAARPTSEWPECAEHIIVTPTTLGGESKQRDGSMKAESLTYLLAAGDPRVMQLTAPADRKPDEPAYLYLGVRPLKTDKDGRITEGRIWLALCKEPPNPDRPLDQPKGPPLPGLKMLPKDAGCLADAPGPVRNAVKQTERWLSRPGYEETNLLVSWVRDGTQ